MVLVLTLIDYKVGIGFAGGAVFGCFAHSYLGYKAPRKNPTDASKPVDGLR